MKIRFNRIEWFTSASIGLLSLGALVIATSPVKAEPYSNCFMKTQTGELVDLSSICGKKVTPSQSNSSEVRAPETPYRINAIVSQSSVPGQYLQSGRFNVNVRLGTVIPVGSSSGLSPLLNSYTQWKQLSDISSLRSDPFGGSLVGQLYKGEPVRVYRDTRTDNSVYVETLRGQRGWIDTWALPDASGLLP